MLTMLTAAKAAKTQVSHLTTSQKNAALLAMADALIQFEADILAANEADLEAARGTVSDVMLDRLLLTPPGLRAWPRASGKWPTCPILLVPFWKNMSAATVW